MPLSFVPDAFKGIPPRDVKILVNKAEWIWKHRKEIYHHPLKENLSGYYKRRIDPYRVIYSYDSKADEMIVHLAGTRDSIYTDAAKQLS